MGDLSIDSPYRLLRHSKNPTEFIHRVGIMHKHVQRPNRNFGRHKNLDVIRIISTKPLPSADRVRGTNFHRTDCLSSTCPTSQSAACVLLHGEHYLALYHPSPSFPNSL